MSNYPKLLLHPDRLFPSNELTRGIARRLYQSVVSLPIVSPHGHTDPSWFATNKAFNNPAELLIQPDHYVFRMLYSQGHSLSSLGLESQDQIATEQDPKKIWQRFASHYQLFRGTPTKMWMDYVFHEVFGLEVKLSSATAEYYYEHIEQCLKHEDFKPRALFERFNIECLATTESPLDDLRHHQTLKRSGWQGRIITSFRPDSVVDPEYTDFQDNIRKLGAISGEETSSYSGYLQALKQRRQFFIEHGATSSDHGHPSAQTAKLSPEHCQQLFTQALEGTISPNNAELFRGQMLTEMAKMSLSDGLVMQIHPGCFRNHNQSVFEQFGRDKGADLPLNTEYIKSLKPLLDLYGNDPRLNIILFTLDETTYSRELAPLAGHYPCLKLGPAWWFHDSPEGMRRFRQQTTETAGFYNTVGFNDDTRAFLSIPARHDLARRMDCGFLAELVADHRLDEDEALELAYDLSYRLVKSAYKLDGKEAHKRNSDSL